MEDSVHGLQLPVDFEQREQVCEQVIGPVVEFKPIQLFPAVMTATLLYKSLTFFPLYFD